MGVVSQSLTLSFCLTLEKHRLDMDSPECACGEEFRYYDDHDLILNQHEGHVAQTLVKLL